MPLVRSSRLYFLLLLLCSIGIGLQIFIYKVAIIALLLQWFFTLEFKQKFIRLKNNNFGVAFIAFFFLYAISLIWTDDIPLGLNDLLLKSSILILPLVIASQESLKSKQINYLLLSFVLSSLAINLFCAIDAYLSYSKTHNINDFYYHRLTINMHTAYQAMFTCFSIVALIYLNGKKKFISNWLLYTLVIIQIMFILLLSSRMQMLIMTVLLPIYLFSYYNKKKKLYLGIVYTIIIFGFAKLIMSVPSSLNSRYKQTVTHINSIDRDNSDPRKFIWENSFTVINNNWILGAGIGDAKKDLINSYKLNILEDLDLKLLMDSTINSLQSNGKLIDYILDSSIKSGKSYNSQLNQYAKKSLEKRNNRYKDFVKKEYNFHNQYLQVFGTIGISGLLLLLYLFTVPFFMAIKKERYLSAAFLFIVGSSFITESMLEREAGVSFIIFFYMILISSKCDSKPA